MPRLGKQTLAENLQLVAKVVPAKTPLDVIKGVYFQGDGEIITLSATNMEMSVQVKIEMPHFDEFSVVLPAKVVDIMSKMPGDTVDFLISESLQTTLTSGKSKFELNGIPGNDFPILSFPDDPLISFTVNNGALKTALGKTLFACSSDDTRPAFTGACFKLLPNDTLRVCATDTYRLALTNFPVKTEKASEFSFLVPGKLLSDAVKLLPSGETSLVKVGKNTIYFQCKDITVSVRLLEETFPDVERVIPTDFSGIATLDNQTVFGAVSRVRLVNDEGTNSTVEWDILPDAINMATRSKKGKAEESIALTLEGEGCKLVFNSKYLLDGFKAISGENCSLHFSGSNRPVVIKDSADADFIYLLLPIKT